MKHLIVPILLVGLTAACGRPKPETGPVDLTVYDETGAPASGVDVVVHNRKGVPLGTARTDSDGFVIVDGVPRDGMITIARRSTGYPYHLQTITHIQPFETMQFGRPAADPTPASLEINLFSQHPTAKGYVIDAGCTTQFVANYAPVLDLDIESGCADDDGNVSVVVYATDDDLLIHGYSYVVDVPLVSGVTTVNMPDWVDDRVVFNIDIPYVPWGTIGHTRARFVTPTDSFIGPTSIELSDYERSYVIEGTDPIESDFSLPTGFQQALGYSVEIEGNGREAYLVLRDGALPSSRVFDLEKDLGPYPIDVDFALFNGDLSVLNRPSAVWSLNEDGIADAAGFELLWADGPGQPAEFRWDVVSPPDIQSIQVPEMPPELQRFTPLTGDEFRAAGVWLREGDFISRHKDYFIFEPFFEYPDARFDEFPNTFIMKSAEEREDFQ